MAIEQLVNVGFTYTPRDYQRPVLQALTSGRVKRAALLWHRRAGKDLTLLNLMINEAVKRRGVYYYFFPTYNQGKKILWDGIDGGDPSRGIQGKPFLDYIPKEILVDKNETDMQVVIKTRHYAEENHSTSIIQIIGTDKINNIVGTNPVGCVFSEYAIQKPSAWEFIEPILAENGGWAAFAYTPRGQNHGYHLFNYAEAHPEEWFCQKLTVDDTAKPDGSRVVTQVYIDGLRERGVDEDIIQQEYFCSFNGAMQGSYYGKLISAAWAQARVTNVPYDGEVLVNTAWDIGVGDSTAIWFYQQVGLKCQIIDFYENRGEGLPHYASVLKQKGYAYDRHYGPHDLLARELSSGKSRLEIARKGLGINFTVAPRLPVDEGIDAVRRLLSKCWFDEQACGKRKHLGHTGLDCLANYHKEWDEDTSSFSLKPEHDWSSHAADAFRYLAVTYKEPRESAFQSVADHHFDVFEDRQSQADHEFNPWMV